MITRSGLEEMAWMGVLKGRTAGRGGGGRPMLSQNPLEREGPLITHDGA